MDDITKSIQDARALRNEHLLSGFSNAKSVIENEEDFTKGDESEELENPFNKATEEEDDDEEVDLFEGEGDSNKLMKKMNKSEEDSLKKGVYNTINYSDNLKVSKTGKEIKEQVNSKLLPNLQTTLELKEGEADDLLENCGKAPTKDVDSYWIDNMKIKCSLKVYDWNELYVNNDSSISSSLSAEDAKNNQNFPENESQSESRRKYNDIVRNICSIKLDIKACEILQGLKDSKSYDLPPRQIISLEF